MWKMSDNRPIGIFDSGVGGLTVVKEVMRTLPDESIVYFGDMARVPYGTKSKETVTRYATQIIRFLCENNVKSVIIACNTVSSNCVEELRAKFPNLPIVEVVSPGVTMALRTTRNGIIGVVGTTATINSHKYRDLLQAANPKLQVFGTACNLFVPLVEEGWADHEVTERVAREYVQPLLDQGIDSLILGCTHYPLLTGTLSRVVADAGVTLINPAEEAARQMGEILKNSDLSAPGTSAPSHRFCVSDSAERFRKLAGIFLGRDISEVETVTIESY